MLSTRSSQIALHLTALAFVGATLPGCSRGHELVPSIGSDFNKLALHKHASFELSRTAAPKELASFSESTTLSSDGRTAFHECYVYKMTTLDGNSIIAFMERPLDLGEIFDSKHKPLEGIAHHLPSIPGIPKDMPPISHSKVLLNMEGQKVEFSAATCKLSPRGFSELQKKLALSKDARFLKDSEIFKIDRINISGQLESK